MLSREPVERVVGLACPTDETGEGEDGALAGDELALSVDVADGDLDRGVVLGLDQASSGSALARDVKVDEISL